MKKVFVTLIILCLAAVLLPQPTAAQAASTEHQFTLVTDVADVLSGGQFVIVSVYGSTFSGAMGTEVTPQTDFRYMNEIKPVDVTINNFGKLIDPGSEMDPLSFSTGTDLSDVTVSGNNLPIWTIAPADNGVSLYANGSYLACNGTITASPTPYSWSIMSEEYTRFVFFSESWMLCYTHSGQNTYEARANGNIVPGIHVTDMLLFKLQGDHNYEAVVTTKPTCTTPGVTTYTCPCGHSYTEAIPAGAHVYTSKVTAPTCTTDGYTTYTCTICGDSYVKATKTRCVLVDDFLDVHGGGRFVIVAATSQKYYGALGTTFPEVGYFNEIDAVPVTIENFGKTSGDYEEGELEPLYNFGGMGSVVWSITGENLPIWTVEPMSAGVSLYANGRYLVYDPSWGLTTSSMPKAWSTIQADFGSYNIYSEGMELGYIESAQNEYAMHNGRNYNPDITTRSMLLFKVVDGSALGHSCEPWPIKHPTCTEKGILSYICSRCTFSYTWEIPSEGHYYTSEVTAPTCTENGYTTYTCTTCGDSYVDKEVAALGHQYADGACTNCGKAVTVPTLTGVGFTLSFEDEVLVNYYYEAENAQDVVEQGMLVFYENPGAADIARADDVYTGSVLSNDAFANSTRGIAAKDMGDERYYCAYAKLIDGTYAYSDPYSYSPEMYALGRLQNSSNQDLKALCVAMLNYGAAAQNFFGYRTDDLMNASLTAEQQALVANYDASLFTGAVAADPAKIGSFAKTPTGFSKKSASVSFEGAFSINYYFTPEFVMDGDMTMYVWEPETYEAVETLTADNAAATVMTNQNGAWVAAIRGIAPKDLDKTFYVAGVYADESGNTYSTGVMAYSLSKYCMNNAYGSMGDLSKSTAMYGYYANLYFSN